jgi:hypothetical protein
MREQPLRESVAAIELPGLGPNAAASRRGFSNAVSRWMVIVRTPLHGWRGPTLAAIAGFSARQMGTCVGVNDVPGRVASKNAPAAIYSKNHPTFMGIFGVSLQMLMKSSPRRQPEVRMSMCPVLGTLGSIRIHRTCRIVAGLAACSASFASKIQTWSHMASASRARSFSAGRLPTLRPSMRWRRGLKRAGSRCGGKALPWRTSVAPLR